MKRTKFPIPKKDTIAKLKAIQDTLQDDSIMPFGKYHDSKTEMANVPAWYLLNLYYSGKCFGAVKAYIKDNLEGLEAERNFKNANHE